MPNTIIQSITAYTCRICKKYSETDLLCVQGEEKKDIFELLDEYFKYINKCKVDTGTQRAIMLNENINKTVISNGLKRIIVKPDAGKALENFSVINISSNKILKYSGDDNSAIYPHYVFCYSNGEKCVFVFHHYGQSGCKTVFQNTFNKFLSEKGLIARFDVLMSNEMFEEEKSTSSMQKLKLISTYNDISSDIADNAKGEQKKTEQEVIISLDAPRAKNIKEWLKKIKKQPDLQELKNILIEDAYYSDFEEAKVLVKFGKAARLISLSDFSGMIAEYDITNKIEVLPDKTIREDGFFSVVDEYASSFFEQE